MPHSKSNELTALLEDAGFAVLTDRAFLRVTGSDATRWLNGMVSNSIQALQPGEGNYNFLLNAQGRIQGDAMIYREPAEGAASYLLETDRSQLEPIQQTLDRFIIMDDVELTPIVNLSGVLVAGPKALSIVSSLGTAKEQAAPCTVTAELPPAQTGNIQQTSYGGAAVWLIQAFSPKVPRFEIWCDPSTLASIVCELTESAAVPVSATALEWLRLLEVRPEYGVDIRNTETARDLPQETAQAHALHFAKGCYLGQEIVERIRSRGQVHRRFMAFRLTGELPSTLPAVLEANGKPAGELTSAALVPLAEGPVQLALGYARQEAVEAKLPLTYPGGIAVPQRETPSAG
jgi:folate-binding protein YgfZ